MNTSHEDSAAMRSQTSARQSKWKQLPMPSAGLLQDSQTTHATILTDSMSLRLQKVKSGMESPVWNVSMVDIHLRKIVWVYCPAHAGVTGNDQTDRMIVKTNITSGLHLGRSEVLRSLRHHMWAQNQSNDRSSGGERRGKRTRQDRRQSKLTTEPFQRQHWRKF